LADQLLWPRSGSARFNYYPFVLGVVKSFVKKIARIPVSWGKRAWSWGNDLWLGIETSDADERLERDPAKPWPFSFIHGKPKHPDSIVYGAAEYFSIRRLIRTLGPEPHDVVLDLGCGKGRVLCEFARHRVEKVIGVELNETHCATARRNAARLRGRRSPVEIRCEDAASTDVSDCTIVFMFNPFGADTMREVLLNLQASLKNNPRRLSVVYYTPRFQEVFRAFGWLHRKQEMKTLGGDDMIVWETVPD
jgi:precorrin-6B methylase 2